MKNLRRQYGEISQRLLVVITVVVSVVLGVILMVSGQKKTENVEEEHESHAEKGEHDESEVEQVMLTPQQIVEQGIKFTHVEEGQINQIQRYSAKLIANTDRQAHVSPTFSGQVKTVHVTLGQTVKKGQALASLFVPELVDQQAQLQVAQTNLALARQDYTREHQLWLQGISAKQDEQRAENAYRQAQIQVNAAQLRLSAFGGAVGNQGVYTLRAPISGVVSQKDLVIGENVQLASQLFVIDQLDQLWLEFVVPEMNLATIQSNPILNFQSLQTQARYQAKILALNTEADTQTGRLKVRAQVLSKASELRPNLMVNVELEQGESAPVLRIEKAALQKIDNQDSVFVTSQHDGKMIFKVQPVEVGKISADEQWLEIKSGLEKGQSYVHQGSFLLKSELEKGEASHEH